MRESLIWTASLALLLVTCQPLPEEPQRTNPLDVHGPNWGSDPSLFAVRIIPEGAYINTASVSLLLTGTALRIKVGMSVDFNSAEWQDYALEIAGFSLGDEEGWKHVYAWFANESNVVGPVEDSVGLDGTVAADSIWWTVSREDSVLLVGDTVQVWLQMEPDTFGPESGGHGVASMPQGVQSIALTDLGSGLYRGIHRLGVADSAAHGQVTAMFRDRAGNVLGPLQATRALDVCWLEIMGSTDSLALYSCRDVAIQGSYAYVADWNTGLKVVDVSNPTNPQIVGSCGTLGGAFWHVAAQGSYAYVTDYDSGLAIVDISTPSYPQIVGSCGIPGWTYSVAAQGYYAYVTYVAETDSGLLIVDIGTPSNPRIVGSCHGPGFSEDLAVQGSYAYVTYTNRSLQVVDISIPSNPQIVGSRDLLGHAHGVAVQGSYAYVMLWNGLQVVDISTPSNPQTVGSCSGMPGDLYEVAVQGSYAYAASTDGLLVVDVSTPSNPQIVGSLDTPVSAGCVAIQGSYAYVPGGYGVQVICVPW